MCFFFSSSSSETSIVHRHWHRVGDSSGGERPFNTLPRVLSGPSCARGSVERLKFSGPLEVLSKQGCPDGKEGDAKKEPMLNAGLAGALDSVLTSDEMPVEVLAYILQSSSAHSIVKILTEIRVSNIC